MSTQRLCAGAALALLACSGSAQKAGTDVSSTTGDPSTDTASAAQTPVEKFAAECRDGLEKARQLMPALLEVDGARTIDNTLSPYNEMLLHALNSAGTAELMNAVHPDEAIREAAATCKEEVASFLSDLGRNRKLFESFSQLDAKGLDADAKRLVEHSLRDFRRSGVDKDEATRNRLKAIDDELTKLSNDFGKNIREDVRQIEIAPEKLAGLPDDYIANHKPNAAGKVVITTNYPDYVPFMSYADDNEARRDIYIKFRSRGDKGNEALLRDILTLRAEKAKILGYDSWADYITEDKMVKSAKNARDFIERVVKTAKARGQRDYKELLAHKKKHVEKKAKVVNDWEKSYLQNKVQKAKYEFDSQAVRPYFPYAQVEAGLLDLTAEIYQVRYEKVADAEVWHKDVKVFDVFAKDSGDKLGRIYLDMHPRDGKYKHAAQFPYQTGVAGHQLPEGALVCNFPQPSATDPGLMEHGDVETMFHEFGHLMHHVFGGHQKWVSQSGVATEWDFVEAPSQMFEEWAWSHETLARFAKHHESGEVIPKPLVERMRKAQKFGVGLFALQQMFYASISLGFHTADPSKLDMGAEVDRLQKQYTPFPPVAGTSFHTSFGHLTGYSAIYYTYMWSLVIAKDLLTPFKKNGLMNAEWTAKYRDTILAPGGTKDAADLVETFLGREFNYAAFEDYLAR
jgi:thimet oligopeptidase